MGGRGRWGHAGAQVKGRPKWGRQRIQEGGQGAGKKGKSAHLELVHDATVLALMKAALRVASWLCGDFFLAIWCAQSCAQELEDLWETSTQNAQQVRILSLTRLASPVCLTHVLRLTRVTRMAAWQCALRARLIGSSSRKCTNSGMASAADSVRRRFRADRMKKRASKRARDMGLRLPQQYCVAIFCKAGRSRL